MLTLCAIELSIVVGLAIAGTYLFVKTWNKIDAVLNVLTPEQRKYYRKLTSKNAKTVHIPKIEPITWQSSVRRHK